ncbi:MAG: hypothetical protein ACTSQ6_09975 [Candidatus Heimdallarchaeaceae archaeon]
MPKYGYSNEKKFGGKTFKLYKRYTEDQLDDLERDKEQLSKNHYIRILKGNYSLLVKGKGVLEEYYLYIIKNE